MICPACDRTLRLLVLPEVELNVCSGGCAGIWFDSFGLRKLGARSDDAAALLSLERDPELEIDHDRKRLCPRCGDVKMQRRYFDARAKVEIDECYGCRGIWLDAGELLAIREGRTIVRDRRAAVERFQAAVAEMTTADSLLTPRRWEVLIQRFGPLLLRP